MKRSYVFLFLCLLVSGCATTAVLKDAAFDACGTGNVYLNGWWAHDTAGSSIEVDPTGGYQFAYWIDDAGNVCHGDPGKSGQVGPAVITAYKQKADESVINQTATTGEQLKTFQEIPVSFEHYSGSGPHFVQFYNTLWRSRTDGKIFKTNSDGEMSVPVVLEIGSKACVAPMVFHVVHTAFLPPGVPATSQDPDRCKVRTMPSGTVLSEEDRKRFDVLNLPHGTDIFNVP